MLKSQSTQFSLTFFFGPMGLAYVSMASAVLLTLLMIVLYFTLLGPVALLAIWPLSILIGAISVRLHNDHLRHRGANLLLDRNRFAEMAGLLFATGRAVAIIVVLVAGGLAAYNFGPSAADQAVDSVSDLVEKSGLQDVLDGSRTAGQTAQPLAKPGKTAVAADIQRELKEFVAVAPAAKADRQPQTPPGAGIDEPPAPAPLKLDKPQDTSAETELAVAVAQADTPATQQTASESAAAPAQPLQTARFDDRTPLKLVPIAKKKQAAVAQRKAVLIEASAWPVVNQPLRRQTVKVRQAIVNLRSGPGMEHAIVDTVRRGEALVQFARQGGWTLVELGDAGQTAWVFEELVSP